VALYRLTVPPNLTAPTIVAAFDGWIDAGSASTTAATHLARNGPVVATFEGDALFDYRSRRPTLEIQDGRLAELTWPEITLRHVPVASRDLFVLAGAEPDFRWHEFAGAALEIVERLGVVAWVSLGAIPAAVPHTRPIPIIGTASAEGLLMGGVERGPEGLLRVPAACLSVLEMTVAAAGTKAVGYYAQVPHYVSGPYPAAARELLRALGRHIDVEIPTRELEEEAHAMRTRLDLATSADDTTKSYVARLEAMADEERLPSGDELISDIERFLRDRGSEGTQRS
jgi:proteasome assembly chaperone (PAC2) family protein